MLVPPKTGGGRSHFFGASPHHPFLLLEPRGHHHISTPPMGEAGEPGDISSSERTFPHGWIQSRERSGEGGQPAFKPATLAQPLVSGSTGNTWPCSPGQTCSQSGKADPPLGTRNLLLAAAGEERRLPGSPLCRMGFAVAIPKGERAFSSRTNPAWACARVALVSDVLIHLCAPQFLFQTEAVRSHMRLLGK